MIILIMTYQEDMALGFVAGWSPFFLTQVRVNPLIFVICIYPKMVHLAGELKVFFIQVMSLMRLGPAQFCTASVK